MQDRDIVTMEIMYDIEWHDCQSPWVRLKVTIAV